MDGILRVDVIVLAVMLACTLVLLVRVSRCYRLALQKEIDTPDGKRAVASLRAHVRSLKSIASTATYLGLLGTCSGILSALSGGGGAMYSYVRWFASMMAAALVPCVSGIVVAVPATCGYTYGCTRLELLAKGLPNPNRLRTRPFTEVTSFGLITAWFLPFTPLPNYKGFDLGISSVPCDTSDNFIVLRISSRGGVFVNEEETNRRTLQSRLLEMYRIRPNSVVYFLADDGVPLQTVADAIDTAKSMNVDVHLVTPRGVNPGCSEPRLLGSPAQDRSR
jgi:hypothetical protein